jgi:putative transposase
MGRRQALSDSKPEVYLHFVWATKLRQPSIPPRLERALYRVIRSEVKRQRCEMKAVGGMPDHVHLLVRFGRTVTLGRFMNQIKGVSSAFLNDKLHPGIVPGLFRWQPGYGVFSVSQNHVERVIAYINNQKQHHASGKVWEPWEQTTDEDDVGDISDTAPDT